MALQEEFEHEGNWLFRYRSYLPISLLVIGLGISTLTRDTMPHYWGAYQYICLLVSLTGVVVRIFTVGHTPAGTSGRNTKAQVAECLNTTGIYSVVRHPLYLGNFLIYLGIAMLTFSLSFVMIFALVYWLYYERIMYAEEKFLRKKFGIVYEAWANVTPAFVPRIKAYRRAAINFSWRKVLKKEKNGVFAMFAVFCLFDIVNIRIGEEQEANFPIFIMCGVACMAYFILKYMKKRTHVLDETGR